MLKRKAQRTLHEVHRNAKKMKIAILYFPPLFFPVQNSLPRAGAHCLGFTIVQQGGHLPCSWPGFSPQHPLESRALPRVTPEYRARSNTWVLPDVTGKQTQKEMLFICRDGEWCSEGLNKTSFSETGDLDFYFLSAFKTILHIIKMELLNNLFLRTPLWEECGILCKMFRRPCGVLLNIGVCCMQDKYFSVFFSPFAEGRKLNQMLTSCMKLEC